MSCATRILYLSHGGGPLPLLDDAGHREMVHTLKQIAAEIPKPKAILLVSAHWEAEVATLTAATAPQLIYDYYGFPPQSYEITYPAAGSEDLSAAVFERLAQQNIPAQKTLERGFDHGLYVPLKIMYPRADIPCVQLSLLKNLAPGAHLSLGQALRNLPFDDLLVIGSGFSFHNMRAFFTPDTDITRARNESFDSWLVNTCSDTSISESDRIKLLREWEHAPSARFCHPREEHLLPLHVCYGCAGRACSKVYQLSIINKKSCMFLWD